MSLGEDVQRAAKRVAELTEMCLRAELAEAKARIAELEEALHVTLDEREEEMARAEQAEKRIAELEGVFSHVGVETRKWLDPECGHEGCQSLVLKARIEELESQCLQWMKVCTREGEEHFLKRMWQFEREKTALIARAEQAEAQLAEARAELASNKLVIDQLAHERNGAESGLKAMRELVSKQAEDEGLWFVPVSITEDYLQRAIRALHEAIEGKSSSECARAALATSPAEREG